MPTLELFVVSQGVAVDSATNRLSIFEIIEELSVFDVPAVTSELAIVCVWKFEPRELGQEQKAGIRFVGPKIPTQTVPTVFTPQEGQSRFRTIMRVPAIPILADAGEFEVTATLNDQSYATYRIPLKKMERSIGTLPIITKPIVDP